MPSGPKKRRASRRKHAEAELVLSTAGATESCCVGSMETDVAAEVSNDAVQLSQQVEEHVSNTLLEPKGNIGGDMTVPEVVSDVVVCGTCLSEVAVENEIGSNVAVHLVRQEHVIDVVPSTESPALKKLYNFVQVDRQVEEHGLQSEVAVKNEIGSMETDIAAEVSNVAVHLVRQEHVIDVAPSTESPALKKLCDVVQVDQEVEEHGLQSDIMGLVDGEDGNVPKEIDSTKSDEGVEVSELEEAVESDGIVVGDAQLASKKDNKDIESFTREGTLPSLNGGCMSVEKADNSQDVGLNVMLLSQENQEDVFDVMPLKKLNDAVKLSQQVDSVVMELLNGNDGNMQNENGFCNGGFSVPGVEELTVETAIKLASKKDEKHGESVGDDSALSRNLDKLLHLVEQIELLVQEAKGLIIAQQKEQIKCDE